MDAGRLLRAVFVEGPLISKYGPTWREDLALKRAQVGATERLGQQREATAEKTGFSVDQARQQQEFLRTLLEKYPELEGYLAGKETGKAVVEKPQREANVGLTQARTAGQEATTGLTGTRQKLAELGLEPEEVRLRRERMQAETNAAQARANKLNTPAAPKTGDELLSPEDAELAADLSRSQGRLIAPKTKRELQVLRATAGGGGIVPLGARKQLAAQETVPVLLQEMDAALGRADQAKDFPSRFQATNDFVSLTGPVAGALVQALEGAQRVSDQDRQVYRQMADALEWIVGDLKDPSMGRANLLLQVGASRKFVRARLALIDSLSKKLSARGRAVLLGQQVPELPAFGEQAPAQAAPDDDPLGLRQYLRKP